MKRDGCHDKKEGALDNSNTSPGGSGASVYLHLAGTSVPMCQCLAFSWHRLLQYLAPLYDTAAWPLARRLPALERTRFVMAKRIVKKHPGSSSDCQAGSYTAP